MLSFQAKTVVITGGGRGIGLGLARYFSKAGAAVVVNDSGAEPNGKPGDPELAQSVAADLRAEGAAAAASGASIALPETAEALVSTALREFGRLDVWVNAAAITRDRTISKMTDEEWSATIATNLTGTFYAMRSALRHMQQQRAGRVINLVSTAGLIGNFGQANYAASKAGVFALTRVAAIEMARHGVLVNAVVPFAYTRMTDSVKGVTPEQQAYLDRARRAKVEHLLPFFAYLASDFSDGVSGQLFGVRGYEVFLFSQARPVRVVGRAGGWDVESLAAAVNATLRPAFCSLQTDLELFASDPLV
jgi:NAD(P)-dependent dehydrogenase (short-subunit alcohol dehydrogenase family)